jgi:hypothetical protein
MTLNPYMRARHITYGLFDLRRPISPSCNHLADLDEVLDPEIRPNLKLT